MTNQLFNSFITTKTQADVEEVNFAKTGSYVTPKRKPASTPRRVLDRDLSLSPKPLVEDRRFEPEFIKNRRMKRRQFDEQARYNDMIDEAIAMAKPRHVQQPVQEEVKVAKELPIFLRVAKMLYDHI